MASRVLIGKGVKAVERQDDIKSPVLIRQRADVALTERDIFESQLFRLFTRLSHHVGRIVKAGYICIRQRLIDRHGQYACADRDFQQFPGKSLRDARQRLLKIIVALRLVHVPHYAAHCSAARRGAGYHSVIKAVAACHAIGAAYRVPAFHKLPLSPLNSFNLWL